MHLLDQPGAARSEAYPHMHLQRRNGCVRARAPTHDKERLGIRALAYDELAVKLFEALFSAVSTHARTRIQPPL